VGTIKIQATVKLAGRREEYDNEKNYHFEVLKQYQLPVYAFPIIFCTNGNIILLIIIIRNKDMRTVPNMYILNLVISDIIYVSVIFYETCHLKVILRVRSFHFAAEYQSVCQRTV